MSDSKDPDLVVHQPEPLNAEPPAVLLTRSFLTPTSVFFVRSHAPAPEVPPEKYRLEVGGLVKRPLELDLAELTGGFEPVTVTATLQCAGNRRDELMAHRHIPGEVPWGPGAVGTARWRGVRLRDVLERAGVAPEAAHVELTGLDRVEDGGSTFGFGGSIPLEWAMEADVLLAYEMNGEPLPVDHGAPLRAVVPGYIGARSVKWLGSITLRKAPSENPFQARSYRLFPPDVAREDAAWERGLSLGELPVNAVITEPAAGADLRAGPLRVRGYALSGGKRRVERVDVSADGGASWVVAELLDRQEDAPGAWTRWEAEISLDVGSHELVARGWDSGAGTQPERVGPIWNFGGYANNAWHRRRLTVG